MEQHNLNNAINMLQEKGVPFAVYQQPDNNEVCLVAQVEPVHLVHDIKEICYSSGFLVFPFESVITGVGYFITSDLFACANNGLGDFIKKIEALPNKISEDAVTETYELSKQEYLTIAQDLIRRLRNKDLQKVVLSRLKVVKPENKLDLASLFLRLLKQYSNTFVYLFSIPDVGTWFGATPEILLSQKANGDVVIMSLAGTTSYVNNGKVDWGNKEVVEQRYVSEFIRERLVKLGIKKSSEGKPETIKAGPLAHIQTIFKVDGSDTNKNIDKMVKALHPTPAVCGLPQGDAYSLIEKVEPHERKFYTGFLGPWVLNGKSDLYVNLRCAEVNNDTLNLYLGGGLTADSDAEKEWNETELKAQTLLSVINNKSSS